MSGCNHGHKWKEMKAWHYEKGSTAGVPRILQTRSGKEVQETSENWSESVHERVCWCCSACAFKCVDTRVSESAAV